MAHLPFTDHLRTFRSAALLLLCMGASGCAASTQSEAEAPAPSSESSEKETVIEDEVPNVKKCHTDTQSCDLTEPLQPGLGCFCPGPGGAQEAGTAGS